MEKNDFLKFLQSENDKIKNLKFKLNKDITEKRIMTNNQRRALFLHITLLALGFSGITYFSNLVLNYCYFTTGIIFLTLCILIIITWMREIIDKDDIGLKNLQDEYNNIIDGEEGLIEKFTTNTIGDFQPSIYEKYCKEVCELPGFLTIKKM